MVKPARGERPDRDGLQRQDIEAAVAARSDLGPAYEPAIVDSLVEQIEAAIETRVDAQLAQTCRNEKLEGQRMNQQMVLGIVSLGTGIPITAIASGEGVAGVLIAWAGIAAVNIAHAVQGWRRG